MSHACASKQYSSGEVHNLIERDANSVWMLLGQFPDLLQIPFEIVVSLFLVHSYVGYCALPGIACFFIAIALSTYS